MPTTNPPAGPPAGPSAGLAEALGAPDPSVRLRAALAAGSSPGPGLLEVLVRRCAAEPDSFVRDMLTWALTRLPAGETLPRLRRELGSPVPRARAQALHTLSKLGDARAWAWVSGDLLRDPDDDVARTAWRTAVALAPDGERARLAAALASQLGRGGRDVRLSLSRALVALGGAAAPALAGVAAGPDPEAAAHARATEALARDPEAGFDAALADARRLAALGPERAAAVAAGQGAGS
ncbi:HEAT repeat domain-containing protein [Geodermatophilus sp. SYSU D01106]